MARVLVIDDDPWVRESARDLLQALGHEVVEAKDGETGIAAVAAAPFDLALLDVRLPRMEPGEVLAGLRAHAPTLPVVVYTGLLRDQVDPALLAAPDVGYLEKPFTLEQVEAELARMGIR
ncbi:MAG: response regulator [Myxococcota bacterium]